MLRQPSVERLSSSDSTPLLPDRAPSAQKYSTFLQGWASSAPHARSINGPYPESGLPAPGPGTREEPGDSSAELHALPPPPALASTKKAFFNVLITFIGSGVLGLPFAFKRSGWLLACAALVLSACVSLYSMLLLVECRRKLNERGIAVATYSAVGFHACGLLGERAVDLMVLVSQGGCCVAYLVFVAQNFASVVCSLSSSDNLDCLPMSVFLLIATPLQILLSWVDSLAALVPFSIAANVANLLAMGLVMKTALGTFQDFSDMVPYTGLSHVPYAMGFAFYCYENFAMTIPLEASMKNPRRFPFTLTLAVVSITILYLAFGFVGYAAFKQDTHDIITLNLPKDWTSVAVKLALCLGIFLTFPIQMHPVHEMAEDNISRTALYRHYVVTPYDSKIGNALHKALRSFIVVASAIVAARVPGFADFIALVGSSVCAFLAFVFPGLCHFSLSLGEELTWSNALKRVGDIALILFGILFAVFGTIEAVHSS